MTFRRLALIGLTASSISLLGGCGGGGGGANIPTASNAAITPPPANPISVTTGQPEADQRIASAAFQSLDGAGLLTAGASVGVVGAKAQVTGAETARLTVGRIVRRHAERIRDAKNTAFATGAQIVSTIPCDSGSFTFVFDDVSGNASEVYVNCSLGGVVFHGTISSTVTGQNVSLGSAPGESYSIQVSANIFIDLSVRDTFTTDLFVTQGSFSFGVTFSGTMVSDGSGGVQPGFPTRVEVSLSGPSLLATDGVNTERLSDFNLTFIDDDATSTTTISGEFTYASSAIGGAVTVSITAPIVYDYSAVHPKSGVLEITGTSGKIVLTVPSPSGMDDVRVEVYQNASGTVADETYDLAWTELEALV